MENQRRTAKDGRDRLVIPLAADSALAVFLAAGIMVLVAPLIATAVPPAIPAWWIVRSVCRSDGMTGPN